jgi:hypothetical protein
MRRFMIPFVFEIVYVTLFGLFYGGLLGGATGMFIMPGLGSYMGAMYGASIGVGVGFVVGGIIGLIHLFGRSKLQASDYTTYLRVTMFVSAIFCCIVTLIVVAPTIIGLDSRDGSWTETVRVVPTTRPQDILQLFTSMMGFVFVLPIEVAIIGLAAMWSFLACACTVHYMIHFVLDPDYNFSQSERGSLYIFGYFARYAWSKGYFIVGAFVGAIAVFSYNALNTYSATYQPGSDILLGALGGMCVLGLLVLCCSLFLGFINRVFLFEFFTHWSEERYNTVATLFVGLLAGFLGFLCAGILGSVASGFIFFRITRAYLVAVNTGKDKLKRVVFA